MPVLIVQHHILDYRPMQKASNLLSPYSTEKKRFTNNWSSRPWHNHGTVSLFDEIALFVFLYANFIFYCRANPVCRAYIMDSMGYIGLIAHVYQKLHYSNPV